MRLKEITLVFENCDSITIDGKYVGNFLVDDTKTSVKRIACNAIEKIDICYTFAIEIHKDANKVRHAFEQTQIEDFKEEIFTRISRFNDITSIEFELEETYIKDGEMPRTEVYNYWVDWAGDSEYANKAQTSYISTPGNLYLIIAKDKCIEDFFNMEEINNEKVTNFRFSMCKVGDKNNDEREQII